MVFFTGGVRALCEGRMLSRARAARCFGRERGPLPNLNYTVMPDLERIFPGGAPQSRVKPPPAPGLRLPGRWRRSPPGDVFGSSGAGGDRPFPREWGLGQERAALLSRDRSTSKGARTGPPAPPAVQRGVFDNCAIYLANKFADQLIPVTAALPRINYSEFKYNHWLIPTSSGPRLTIHPRE